MINVNEIRIGNVITEIGSHDTHTKEPDIAVRLDSASICYVIAHPEIYQPIPLDGKWLGKMGYMLAYSEKNWYHSLSRPVFHVHGGEFSMINVPARFRYVHQLQNLFFALTGEELQITLP